MKKMGSWKYYGLSLLIVIKKNSRTLLFHLGSSIKWMHVKQWLVERIVSYFYFLQRKWMDLMRE